MDSYATNNGGVGKDSSLYDFEPAKKLRELAKINGLEMASKDFASLMDEQDELHELRKEFCYPLNKESPHVDLSLVDGNAECVYFCGNSLGLMPKECRKLVKEHLDKWAAMGVYGHHLGDRPWKSIEEYATEETAELVGAKPIEVVVMNALTVNVNLMMVPFYRPTSTRHKILMEGKAFPSDQYAIKSQVNFHGYKPQESIIEVFPRKGEETLKTEDILKVIEEQGDSIALVMFSGVQYYTGQFFDMKTITSAAQKKGCVVGWDLAHAVGNVELHLHDWNVDFACWCNYKYLNSGPGAISGVFVHERHAYNFDLPRFSGWWGTNKETRFQMNPEIEPIPGAEGFQISNPAAMQTELLIGSLNVFKKTSIKRLRAKGDLLTAYLEILLLHRYPAPELNEDTDDTPDKKQQLSRPYVKIITPADPKDRGCQLSVKFSCPVQKVHKELEKRGVVVDTRNPDVMRIAPVHMYNSFTDVQRFIDLLEQAFNAVKSLDS
ncbi:kynureninase-like [Actinia tenebrosa]|uniref:Kynureninase n=1 Tax=Actinia tenebrosa TaxID=6105 RepID=A0A6P8GX72_ACTTE|nr:kynureninase-like [Actinia tenebrosa]